MILPKTSAAVGATGPPDDAATRTCPLARSTTCYQIADKEPWYIATGCRKWTCEVCGPRKRAELVYRIVEAEPERFITLTCRHEGTPELQFERMKVAAPRLWSQLRKTNGAIDYVRLHEECVDGYPHFHFLVRSGFLAHADIKRIWAQLTGATIVDVRKAHGKSSRYVSKYICKAQTKTGQWSRQRVSVSQHFWRTRLTESQFLGFEHDRMHPWDFVPVRYADLSLQRESRGKYSIHERSAGDEYPPELIDPQSTGAPATNDSPDPFFTTIEGPKK